MTGSGSSACDHLCCAPSDIITTGLALGVDYALTTSCYDPAPDGACGVCDACTLRLRGFADAGVADPIAYRNR